MEKIVGFDIGESSVKLVYFAGADLKKAVTAELPDNMVSGSRILSMDAMADFLRQTAKSNGIPLTHAALVLPSTEVFTRELVMPAMTEQQLLYNLPYEFRDYLTEEKNKYFFDYSMREVLRRRLQRAADGDEKFLPLPDVFLIDGGVTHADAVREVAEQFGCTVPIFGMVKDDRHRTRALVTPEGREIGIVNDQAVFSLIGQIQEETHRFAITYHHQHHTKSAMRSALDGVPGLGPKRQAELRKHFGTVKAIREADEDALAAVLPQNVAHTLWIRLHEKEST